MTTTELVGTVFAGYRVERVLGRGGMSVVYLAEHPRLKNNVALKLLAPALADDEVFRERLARESRLAASLNHPNVIPVFDTGEANGVLYISMRFVDGPDLRTLLRSGPLSAERTAAIVRQAAAALDAAHARGLVHRDVKPANILTEGEHVYVADFGLTKHTDAQSGASVSGVVGTVDYMAPEQIEGRQIDERADVYSLGCVLFECLTGRPPFHLDNEVATLWAHIREDPPLPSELHRGVPRAFDGIVDRALAKSPGDRYASAGELAADVAAAVHAKARRPHARLPRARRRSRRAAVVPALVGAILGAAVAAAVLVPRSSHDHAGPPTLAPSLLAAIPVALKPSCVSQTPPTPDFDSSATCHPADPNVPRVDYSHALSWTRMKQTFLDDAYARLVAVPGHAVEPTGRCEHPGGASIREWTVAGASRLESLPSTPGLPHGRLLCFTTPAGWASAEWTDQSNEVFGVAYGKNRYAVYRWWRVRSG